MNLPKIQAIAAPLSAPIPSALGVAVQAYLYFVSQSAILGWIAAIGAFIGIEAIGGASCYAVVKLHRQRSYGIEFYVSLVGILAYIASGYFVLHNTAILIFFILAPFSYFAYAILRSMETEIVEKVSETEAQIKLIETEAQARAMEVEAETKLVEAQIKRINAETRKTKAENVTYTPYSTAPLRVEAVELKPCACGQTFTRSQDKAIHARRCEVWKQSKAARG